jgi:DNA sulfur modification protein DndC
MANGNPIPGPYTQESREKWLTKLLEAQTYIRRNGPPDVSQLELIRIDELQEIRRIWVSDKHELEDSLPRIFEKASGQPYPGRSLDDNLVLGQSEMMLLEEICGKGRLHYELTRELLSLTRQQRFSGRRAGLFDQIEKAMRRGFYVDKDDAVARARRLSQNPSSDAKADKHPSTDELETTQLQDLLL